MSLEITILEYSRIYFPGEKELNTIFPLQVWYQ